MNNTLKYLFLFNIIIGWAAVNASAQGPVNGTDANMDGSGNAVSTAVSFLRISPDARSSAMGDAGIALSPDANSAFWNLSKLPFAEKEAAISLSYTPWMKEMADDIFMGYLSGYKKLDNLQTLAASFRYFNLGEVNFRDMQGMDQGDFHPKEFSFDLGYARKLSDRWSLGMALRYIHSNLAAGKGSDGANFKAGNAVAGDISAFYTHKTNYGNGKIGIWNFGTAITNIGSKISYSGDAGYKYFIPANLGLGGAYTYQFDAGNQITLTLDVNKLLVPTLPSDSMDNTERMNYYNQPTIGGIFKSFGDAPGGFGEEMQELMYSFGVEYGYNDLLALRAGYFNENSHKGNRKYLTVGFGLKYESFGLDFSYLVPSGNGVNKNPLSNTMRFSLSYDL